MNTASNRQKQGNPRPRSGKRHTPAQPGRLGRAMLLILLIAYSAALVYWMFIGFGRSVHTDGPFRYNLEPLRTIKLYFDLDNGVSFPRRLINLLGNVIVFVPFGVLLPLLRKSLRSVLALLFVSALGILLLETMQMLLRVGSFDIDDLLLNLAGVLCGYILLWSVFLKGKR
ncbi:VanZ family protein [Paenibacillus riograndensis]|uniref:VanZ family protein n=1 Tax=Paenibacillus riograndensis TaxID=483937 RepID=UPI001E6441D1|nr:VanZ family protein [Paenibacillus riograndensis]